MSLFQSIAEKARNSALQHAWTKGRMRCPRCNTAPSQAPIDADTTMRCSSCGFEAFPDAWTPKVDGVLQGKPDDIPANTKIRREKYGPRDCVWHFPAAGKWSFFFYFGLIWTTFTTIMASVFFLASSKGEGPEQRWLLPLFFSVFFAVGIGCLYVAFRHKYAQHRLTVSRDRIVLRRELFGRVTEKSILTSSVTAVEQTVFYQQNYQPVYGIEIRGKQRKIRFGTTLEAAEKAWLVADIKRCALGTEPETSFGYSAPQRSTIQAQETFVFTLPSPPRGLWLLGLAFFLIGIGGLIFAGYHIKDFVSFGPKEQPWFARVFELIFSAFSIIPFLVGVLFSTMGATIFIHSRPNSGREIRIEGESTQVFIRHYRRGTVVKELAFARQEVTGVTATRSGHVNNQEIKQIALMIGNKRSVLTRATPANVAETWMNEVNRALGVETPNI